MRLLTPQNLLGSSSRESEIKIIKCTQIRSTTDAAEQDLDSNPLQRLIGNENCQEIGRRKFSL